MQKLIFEELRKGSLTIDDLLSSATPQIEVLAILHSGEKYAREIAQRLGSRAVLFSIDPHILGSDQEVLMRLAPPGLVYVDDPSKYPILEFDYDYFGIPPDERSGNESPFPKPLKTPDGIQVLNPKNTIVICDDVIEGIKHTFRRVRDYLTQTGYDFRSDNPLHFGAIQSVINYEDFGYTLNSHLSLDQIRLVRNFLV